jgi:hypothetical protein
MNGEFVRMYQRSDSVTVANLSQPRNDTNGPYNLRIVRADGRSLPFADKSFDWVFSNALIEHVGNWEDQQQFADRDQAGHIERVPYHDADPLSSYRASCFVAPVPVLS